MSKPIKAVQVALVLLFLVVSDSSGAAPGAFSITGIKGWQPQILSQRESTQYQLVVDDNVSVLQARCERSASGYIWKERIDLRQTPFLNWRWRVHQIYKGLHEREKSGDDFPVRLYVIQDGGWAFWRTRSLVYVWSNGVDKLSDWPNAYTSQAHVIAVRSGAKGLGQWQDERRNLRADFKTYFGVNVDHIDAVALMSDCDDSMGRGTAEYGDIRLGP